MSCMQKLLLSHGKPVVFSKLLNFSGIQFLQMENVNNNSTYALAYKALNMATDYQLLLWLPTLAVAERL